MRRCLVLAALASLCGVAGAQAPQFREASLGEGFMEFGVNKGGNRSYLARRSLGVDDRNKLLRVTVIGNYGEPQRDEHGTYKSSVMTWHIDCAGDRWRFARQALHAEHFGEGRMLREFPDAMPWQPVVRQSPVDVLKSGLCPTAFPAGG